MTKHNRLPNRKLWLLDVSVIAVMAGIISLSLWYSNSRQAAASGTACRQAGPVQRVAVQAQHFIPTSLSLQRCDILELRNTGRQSYDLAFGQHYKLANYPGFDRQILKPSMILRFQVRQAGSFRLHDHRENQAVLLLDIRPD